MKKTVGIICAMALGVSALSLTACGGNNAEAEASTVMNVSLNPQVEFVLDANDTVVSVNALNEEGNLIISADAFKNVEGEDAADAVKLFVQVSKDNGFIVEGNANLGDNEVSISLSGDADKANEIYNDVKAKVEEYFSEENITAKIEQAAAITKAQLEALVAECAPYLEAAEVQAMEYAELVQELVESRKETAEMYSQQLKNAYYEAKAFAFEQAELEVLKSKVGVYAQTAIEFANSAYTNSIEILESIRMENLVAEDSLYQKALAGFRSAKAEYLNFRNYVASLEVNEVTTALTNQLDSLKAVVDNAEAKLIQAGEDANAFIDSAKETVTTAYETLISKIEEQAVKADEYLTEISNAQKEALTEFTTAFENTYANAKAAAENGWKEMSEKLQQGYNPETNA